MKIYRYCLGAANHCSSTTQIQWKLTRPVNYLLQNKLSIIKLNLILYKQTSFTRSRY